MSGRPLQVVWFKRDLRTVDHRPLFEAAAAGPVLPLYVVEPELWAEPDASARQWAFAAECLEELRDDLRALGLALTVRVGDVIDILSDLRERYGALNLRSHEETGNAWTFERDKRVKRWARDAGTAWTEERQFGVQRALASRSGWAAAWDRQMAEPPTPEPTALEAASPPPSDEIPDAEALGLAADPCPERQRGGRAEALALLHSFLDYRGRRYRVEMSSPVVAYDACSRLSPHLAWGTLSIREVAQATYAKMPALKGIEDDGAGFHRASLSSYSGRLHWHCHFMQKLEDEPSIEWKNFHPGYDGLRPDPEPNVLEAWIEGRTGFPFIDACMRALKATGWMNFRMRAMLTAFSSYHLWSHWREPGLALARRFTDYEAGIHWSQSQMQSGTTGINTVRIYNPVKQSLDQDPDGVFIREWVPELRDVPATFVHEPWKLSPLEQEDLGLRLGREYPERLIDHVAAAKHAREQIYAHRREPGFREIADAIQEKHGSRKSGMRRAGRRPKKAARSKTSDVAQSAFDLGDG